MWLTATWATVCILYKAATSLYHLRQPRSSKPLLSTKEGRRVSHGAEDDGGEGELPPPPEKKRRRVRVRKRSMEEKPEGSGEEDEDDEDEPHPDPLMQNPWRNTTTRGSSSSSITSLAQMTHLQQQSKRKLKRSCEKSKGTDNLLENEPYSTHLRWARKGYVDAYHPGYPCSTFSKLRFRPADGHAGASEDFTGTIWAGRQHAC